ESIERAEQACKSGDVLRAAICIEHLLRGGTPVEHLQYCLLAAVETENHELVRTLLHAGTPITSLVIKPALQQNSLCILSSFLEYGWDINQEEAWCIPPWLAIATNPNHALISWFLDNGADPDMACQTGTTPLSTAVAKAPLSIVQRLLQSCPETRKLRRQLLHFAARRTDDPGIAVLQLVLDACEAEINARMWQDCPLAYECYKVTGIGTALHENARAGRRDLAEIILSQGADISIRDSCRHTALEVAEIAGNDPVADLLKHIQNSSRISKEL
ncbi:ankyrin, partial [Teratosphaeria nubilosa]